MEKFNNANGVIQRAVMAKRVMNRRSGGGRNRGVDGMIRGGGSRFKEKQDQLACSSQEVAMVRMKNWANRDTASVEYGDDDSYDSYVGRNDRGSSSYSRRSRSRSRGRYKDDPPRYKAHPPPVRKGKENKYGDDGYDDEYNSGYDEQNGQNDEQDDGHRRHMHMNKSTPRESIGESDQSQHHK